MSKIDFSGFLNRKKMSQTELANILGVTQQTVNMYCNGRSGITFARLAKLIDLGITPEELFGEKYAAKLKSNALQESSVLHDAQPNLSDDTVLNIVSRGLGLMLNKARG